MISKRIKEIAKLINNDESVIDIGCDHGYLAKNLRDCGHEALIICSDEKKGPLDNAKANLSEYDNIEYKLADGVKDDISVDVAVMAGMGHNTVEHIIFNNLSFFNNCKKIIIQVNTYVDLMRQWLMNNGFKIIDERILLDYKYYEILVVTKGDMELSISDIKFGPYLSKEKNDVFIDKYIKEKDKLTKIKDSLINNSERVKELEDEIKLIEEVLNS